MTLFSKSCSKGFHVKRFLSTGFITSEAKQWIRGEVEKFNISVPVESAVTPPTSWYTTSTFYDFEKLAIFGNNYWAIDSLHRLEEPHSYVTAKIADEPYLVTNAGEGESIRGFFNVCRHHGTKVEWKECGKSATFSCPYHGWTYDSSGKLIKATRLRAIENFSAKCNGLEEVDVFGYWPTLWVKPRRAPVSELADIENMNSMARGLDEKLTQLKLISSLPMNSKDYESVGRRIYDLKCNWKVYVDNYLDGGYHVKFAHKALASLLDVQTYKIEGNQSTDHDATYQWSVQSVGSNSFAGPETRIGKRAGYFHLYPNAMFNFYGPWLDVNYVIPTGPETCQVVFDWFLNRSEFSKLDKATRQSTIAQNLSDSDKVQQEDIELCERVQEGNRGSSYQQGRYAPRVELLMHAFHKRLAAEYLAYMRKSWPNASPKQRNS